MLCTPPLLFLFGVIKSPAWYIHPGVSAIQLIYGSNQFVLVAITSLIVWNVITFTICEKQVQKAFRKMEGAKI